MYFWFFFSCVVFIIFPLRSSSDDFGSFPLFEITKFSVFLYFCQCIFGICFYFKYLFTWLCWVVVAAHQIFHLHHSTWTLSCSMWDLVSWPGIEPQATCTGSMEPYPLDHQGSCWDIFSISIFPTSHSENLQTHLFLPPKLIQNLRIVKCAKIHAHSLFWHLHFF